MKKVGIIMMFVVLFCLSACSKTGAKTYNEAKEVYGCRESQFADLRQLNDDMKDAGLDVGLYSLDDLIVLEIDTQDEKDAAGQCLHGRNIKWIAIDVFDQEIESLGMNSFGLEIRRYAGEAPTTADTYAQLAKIENLKALSPDDIDNALVDGGWPYIKHLKLKGDHYDFDEIFRYFPNLSELTITRNSYDIIDFDEWSIPDSCKNINLIPAFDLYETVCQYGIKSAYESGKFQYVNEIEFSDYTQTVSDAELIDYEAAVRLTEKTEALSGVKYTDYGEFSFADGSKIAVLEDDYQLADYDKAPDCVKALLVRDSGECRYVITQKKTVISLTKDLYTGKVLDTDDRIDLVIYDLTSGRRYCNTICAETSAMEEQYKRYLENGLWPFIADLIK